MNFECRSALFMPASNARVLAKGPVTPADAVIVDLEDSVAPELKELARKQATQILRKADYGYRLKALRINAFDTPWFAEDINAVIMAKPNAVVLPKVDSVDDIARLSNALDADEGAADVAIWAMMESAAAVVRAPEIAASRYRYPRLSTWLVGNNDMARSANMPVTSDRSYLIPWLMSLIAAAKTHKLAILDGVYNDFKDTPGFAQECEQAKAMGMNGKTLIHPSQIDIANQIFAPSDDDIAQATAIVDAFADPAHAEAGVLQIDGKMIERLHLDMAIQLLARAKRLARRA